MRSYQVLNIWFLVNGYSTTFAAPIFFLLFLFLFTSVFLTHINNLNPILPRSLSWLVLLLRVIKAQILSRIIHFISVTFPTTCFKHFFMSLKKFDWYFFKQYCYICSYLCTDLYEFDINIIFFFLFVFFNPLCSFLICDLSFFFFVKITFVSNNVINDGVLLFFSVFVCESRLLFFPYIF